MKNLSDFNQKISFLLTDIDDTLTDDGHLEEQAYDALWRLSRAGIKIIPITGRPAGWCEMIARQWPVAAVVGENGGFWFQYKNKKMHRHFFQSAEERQLNQKKLKMIEEEILKSVPGVAVASDQFCRMIDLAIDFCEDVPRVSDEAIKKVVQIFNSHGATAKVSSIHVNGWFGAHDKKTAALHLIEHEFHISPLQAQAQCAYCGDSPNDEPMFEYFPNSFGVANILDFKDQLRHQPQFTSSFRGGRGFAEIAKHLLTVYQSLKT